MSGEGGGTRNLQPWFACIASTLCAISKCVFVCACVCVWVCWWGGGRAATHSQWGFEKIHNVVGLAKCMPGMFAAWPQIHNVGSGAQNNSQRRSLQDPKSFNSAYLPQFYMKLPLVIFNGTKKAKAEYTVEYIFLATCVKPARAATATAGSNRNANK